MFARVRSALFAGLEWVRDLFRVLGPARYSVLVFLGGSITFLVVPQGQDVLRRMVEWGDGRGPFEHLGTTALFVASVIVSAASLWYWARVILYLRPPESAPDTPRQARMREWVPRLLGFLAILAMSVSCWVASDNYLQYLSSDGTLMGRGPILRLRVLSITLAVISVLFLMVITRRRKLLQAVRSRAAAKEPEAAAAPQVAEPEVQYASAAQLPEGTRRTVRIFLTGSVVLGLLFAFLPVPVGQALGTLPIVLLAGANAVMIGTFLLYLSRRARLPLLIVLLVLAMIFSRWNDNHAMRLADGGPRVEPLTIQQQLDRWPGNRPGQPIFVVAAEGGGIRAAYWTAIVLGDLEDRFPGFSRQVFAVSGISGGSLGGAVFAGLAAENAAGNSRRCGGLRNCAASILGEDFLSPTLARMVAPDFVQRFLPAPLPFTDRAQALEDSWADAWEEHTGTRRFDEPFQRLWSGEGGAGVPSLVLNGTHVESGRRIVATNLRWNAGELRDTYDLLRVVKADLPLKTAVHNSARFTYISPAGTMKPADAPAFPWWGKDRGHVVDGGYFENSGTVTALELVTAIQQACGHTCDDRIVMIYLRNSPVTDTAKTPDPSNPDDTLERAAQSEEVGEDDGKELEPFSTSYPRLNELLSPLRALMNTRGARGSLAVKNAQLALSPPGGAARFFEIGLCELVEDPSRPGRMRRAPLPLGWQLSETARQAMEDQLVEGFQDACPQDNWTAMQTIGGLVKPAGPVPTETEAGSPD